MAPIDEWFEARMRADAFTDSILRWTLLACVGELKTLVHIGPNNLVPVSDGYLLTARFLAKFELLRASLVSGLDQNLERFIGIVNRSRSERVQVRSGKGGVGSQVEVGEKRFRKC